MKQNMQAGTRMRRTMMGTTMAAIFEDWESPWWEGEDDGVALAIAVGETVDVLVPGNDGTDADEMIVEAFELMVAHSPNSQDGVLEVSKVLKLEPVEDAASKLERMAVAGEGVVSATVPPNPLAPSVGTVVGSMIGVVDASDAPAS
jgi:hypothetical protein